MQWLLFQRLVDELHGVLDGDEQQHLLYKPMNVELREVNDASPAVDDIVHVQHLLEQSIADTERRVDHTSRRLADMQQHIDHTSRRLAATQLRLTEQQIPKRLPVLPAIGPEVAGIGREDVAGSRIFGGNDERRVGEVHGQYAAVRATASKPSNFTAGSVARGPRWRAECKWYDSRHSQTRGRSMDTSSRHIASLLAFCGLTGFVAPTLEGSGAAKTQRPEGSHGLPVARSDGPCACSCETRAGVLLRSISGLEYSLPPPGESFPAESVPACAALATAPCSGTDPAGLEARGNLTGCSRF